VAQMYTITSVQPENFSLFEKCTRLLCAKLVQNRKWRVKNLVFRGGSPGCRLFSTASMLEWLRNHLPHHSKGSITERRSRNILMVVTARVFYVLTGSLTSLFIFNHSMDTAAPFNVVSHPRCCEPRN